MTYLLTLLSVRMVTFSDGSTLSTSNFQSAASVVDSRISSGLELSLSCCYKRTHFCIIIIIIIIQNNYWIILFGIYEYRNKI